MSDFQFGQPVEFTRHLTRRYRHDPSGRYATGLKVWTSEDYPGQPDPEPCPGIVIGIRTLSNGTNHYHGDDEPITYRATERFTAYLVAYDMRRKPVLVLPEHLTQLEASDD